MLSTMSYFFGFAGPGVVVHYDGSSNDAGTYTVLHLSLTRPEAKARVPLTSPGIGGQ